MESPDLIVKSIKDTTELGKMFHGSIMEAVINNEVIPMFAVPYGFSYQEFKNNLYLTQFKKYEIKLMEKLLRIAARCKANNNVLKIRKHLKNNGAKMLKIGHSKFSNGRVKFNVG